MKEFPFTRELAERIIAHLKNPKQLNVLQFNYPVESNELHTFVDADLVQVAGGYTIAIIGEHVATNHQHRFDVFDLHQRRSPFYNIDTLVRCSEEEAASNPK